MNDGLAGILAQGDADLFRTAGEEAAYLPRSGGEIAVVAAAGPAPVEWVMDGPGGAAISCTRSVRVEKAALRGIAPQPGDRIRLPLAGETLQVMRVATSAHDPGWRLECSVITP